MLTKEKAITTFEINPDGLIILIEETKIIEDSEVISTKREHRHIIPGQDVTGEEERVQAVCLAVHTPEVVGAYNTK